MIRPDEQPTELLTQAGNGDGQALGELFGLYQARLQRVIQVRLDQRLRSRVSPSDVIQETFLEVSRCLAEYLKNPALPFFLWIRLLAQRKLQAIHRHHLGAQCRDVARELPLTHLSVDPQQRADQVAGSTTSPSEILVRSELRQQVQTTLLALDQIDREVLLLRHFEQLTNAETANVLGLSVAAASNRYIRALTRLKARLSSFD